MVKNFLLLALIRFFDIFNPRKNHRRNYDEPRILIISTTGLGDSLWGTPAIRALRKSFPKAYLAMLTSPIGQAIFNENPHLDTIYSIDNPALFPLIKLLPKLRRKKFDTILIFHLSQRPVLPLTYLTKAEMIVGTEGMTKGLDFLLTHPIPKRYEHEIERRLHVVKAIGAKVDSTHMEFPAKGSPFNRLTVIMHPGSKDAFKQWSPKNFITLGKWLVKERGAHILITGNEEEKTLAESIAAEIPHAESMAGKLSLKETVSLIQGAHLMITNDTGPMHIAFSQKTPTLAFFGPTDPNLCGPYHLENVRIIAKEKTCMPCISKKCREPFCMQQIRPEEAMEKIQELLP